MTPFLVIASDLHLRPQTWVKHPELRGDAYCALQQIVDLCLQRGLPLLLLGDIFDSARPDSQSVQFFVEQMQRLHAANLHVAYVQGNHDYATPPWPDVAKLKHLNRQLDHIGPCLFYGLDYTTDPAAAFQQIPEAANVLVAHQAWAEIQSVGHTDAKAPDLPANIRIVLTGDYHMTGLYTGTNSAGLPVTFLSPGSTCLQALNEPPDKYCYLMSWTYDRPEFELHQLKSRPLFRMRVATADELDATCASLRSPPTQQLVPAEISRPIARVQYRDDLPDAFERLVTAAGDNWHLFPEPQRVVEDVVIDMTVTPAGAFEGLLTALPHVEPEGTAVYEATRRLLQAVDVQTELQTLRQEFDTNYETGALGGPELVPACGTSALAQ